MLPVLLSDTLSVDDAGYFANLSSMVISGVSLLLAFAAGGAALVSRTRRLMWTGVVVAVFFAGVSVGMYGLVHRASLPTWFQATEPTGEDAPKENGKAAQPTDTPTETPSNPSNSPAKNAELVTIDLGTINGSPVTAYFGQHRAVKDAMDRLGVTMDQSEGFVDAFPHRCAEGIVVGPLEGTNGVIYAQGFGEGWSGLEWKPSNEVATDDGLIHQQFISPPADLPAGAHLDVFAKVSIDGKDAYTPSFPLQLTSRDGISSTWTIADRGTVTCDVTT